MSKDQPSKKTLDEVLAVVEKLGPEALASQFQEVALELARQQQLLEREIAGFEQQRRQSEADIEQQSGELAQSWLRLEDERRNLRLNQTESALPAPQITQPAAESPPPQTYTPFQNVVTGPAASPHEVSGDCGPSLVEQFQLLAAGKSNRSNQT